MKLTELRVDRLKLELGKLDLPTTGTKNELHSHLRGQLQIQGINIEISSSRMKRNKRYWPLQALEVSTLVPCQPQWWKKWKQRTRSYLKLLEPKIKSCQLIYKELLEPKTKNFWLMYKKLLQLKTKSFWLKYKTILERKIVNFKQLLQKKQRTEDECFCQKLNENPKRHLY